MRKFKLKIEYPGCRLGVGQIVKESKDGNYYYGVNGLYSKECVEDYPQLWEEIIEYPIGTKVLNSQTSTIYIKKEDGWYKTTDKTAYTDEMINKSNYIDIIKDEVVEKDYEILSYINIGSKHVWKQNSELKHVFHLSSNKTFAIGLTDILELPDIYSIHSVKRLSDNVVFTVGDTVQLNDIWSYNCKIKEINIYNNEVAFNIQDKVASASYREFEKFKKSQTCFVYNSRWC